MTETNEAQLLVAHGIVRVRADNPGPFTLSGTNTWIVGSDPAYVIDPGPALAPHLDAIDAVLRDRGGLGGIALTHGHADHSEAVGALQTRYPAPLAAAAGAPAPGSAAAGATAAGDPDVALRDGDRFGPLSVFATPGHAPDHLAFVAGTACFSGDAVLGEGSVFIAPDPGAMIGYLASLRRLRELALDVLCPGHGPPVWHPAAKLDEYVEHRLDREHRLIAALDRGRRTTDELLDDVWSDAPAALRPAAAITLAAHLDKLEEEGRLPPGVQRPRGLPSS